MFQNFKLIDKFTVFEIVLLPLIYARTPAKERKAKVDEVLERVDIAHRREHFPAQLSGGQQQRVAVARAVVTKPALILADEPTGNLDSTNGTEVMQVLHKLNEDGTSILMVTHSAENASYSHSTIRMLDGRIIGRDQPDARAAAARQMVAR